MMTDGNSSISRYAHAHSHVHTHLHFTHCPICTTVLVRIISLQLGYLKIKRHNNVRYCLQTGGVC